MERIDREYFDDPKMRPMDYKSSETELMGTPREAELILAGLKLLRAQVAIRDLTVNYGSANQFRGLASRYPDKDVPDLCEVPFATEIDKLISDIDAAPYDGKFLEKIVTEESA